jgi:hypothetical protein
MVNRRQLLKLGALGTASFAAPLAYSASKTTMTYNTGNPIGSTAPKDLYDNARNLDLFANGSNTTYPDRLGVTRKSWAGLEQQVTDYLIAQSYESVFLPYNGGVVVQRQTQLVQRNGELYRVMNVFDVPLTLSGVWATDTPKLQAVGDAAIRQGLADVLNGDAMIGVKQPYTGALSRTQHQKNADYISATDFAIGDGVTNEQAAFDQMAANFPSAVIDLARRTYLVPVPPITATFVNGSLIATSQDTGLLVTLRAPTSPSAISGATDTGQYEAKYLNPLTGDYQMSGRTTPDLSGLLWSQNSYAGGGFPRSVVVGSIYSYSTGNVAGNYSARQCRSTVPQSVNIGSENCRVDKGVRGSNISSITSHCEGETGVNLGTRRGWNNGYHTANIASVDAYAGGGYGAEFTLTISAGGVTSIGIVPGKAGLAYNTSCTLVFADRLGIGTGATATFTLNADGSFASVTLINGGSGYSDNVQLYVLGSGSYCGNIFTANGCVAYLELSANFGANNCAAKAARSGNLFSNVSKTEGQYSVNMGSSSCSATGLNSMTLGSGSSNATGDSSFVIGGITCNASALSAAVIGGRRVDNNVLRSIGSGDNGAGAALAANMKWRVNNQSGRLDLASTVNINQVFTDVAKMFENIESVTIPVGAMVAWEGRKVRLAQLGDLEFSAHSRTFAMLLGDSTFTWAGRYLVDEFGEKIIGQVWDEEAGGFDPDLNDGDGEWVGDWVKGPLVNPDYDPTLEQVPRSERRDEWTPVALLGEVHVRVDASVSVDDYIKPVSTGLGGASESMTRMRCMEIRQVYDATKGYAVALCLIR